MPGPTYEDILNLSHELQMDLRAANGKLSTIRSWLAAQPEQKRTYDYVCPHPMCQLPLRTERGLAFHLQNVHNGPPVPLTPEEAAA